MGFYFFMLGVPFLIDIPILFTSSLLLYDIMSFMLLFAGGFLSLFSIIVGNPTKSLSSRRLIMILVIYALTIIAVLAWPNGISISTSGRPHISWTFLIVAYLYTGIGIVFPTVNVLRKTLKMYSPSEVRTRLVRILITCLIVDINLYGELRYDAWNSIVYRTIWTVVSFFLFTLTGIIFYLNMREKAKPKSVLII